MPRAPEEPDRVDVLRLGGPQAVVRPRERSTSEVVAPVPGAAPRPTEEE
jgi:hypothetical protein